jgi:hypothetical protein
MPTTTSRPFSSAASYLKFHIPSFSAFQYAAAAECMPRFPDVVVDDAGTCSIMVLVMANLYCGCEVGVDVSWTSDWRIVLMIVVFQVSVEE